MEIQVKDLQRLDIFFEPKKSVSDVISFLDKNSQLIDEAIRGNTTALIDLTKMDYLQFVSNFEWSYDRFREVCRFLDVEVISENNPNKNTVELFGNGDFMILESFERHSAGKSNPFLQYRIINNKIKFQKEADIQYSC